MRSQFINTLVELATNDTNVWLLTGDLGFSFLEVFRDRFPQRFVNVGIAEQNMIGLAAGLALEGKTVFVYSIANFAVMRCLEQIRNDLCYHNLDVKIVTVGGGLVYGPHGYTHYGIEDVGVLSLLPNMTIMVPADSLEAEVATRCCISTKGPCYLRLDKDTSAVVHQSRPTLLSGRLYEIVPGSKVAAICSGPIIAIAMKAAEELRPTGVHLGVYSAPFPNHVASSESMSLLKGYDTILTIEEHGRGGLGAAVAEQLTESLELPGRRLVRHYVRGSHELPVGTRIGLLSKVGLDVAAIVCSVRSALA